MSNDDDRSNQCDDFATLIVAIANDRDREAFARLFSHFAPRVKTLMLRLGATPALAEELAQDTLLTVWHKAGLFDPAGASASGWIYRIARNLRIDALRRDLRMSLAGADPSDEAEAPLQPDQLLSATELESQMRKALAQLSEEQVQVITLSFFEDRPHAEISGSLNLPLGTVKSRLRLAMKRLRELLDDPS